VLAALMATAGPVRADVPIPMAPPVSLGGGDAAYNWTEIPAHERVPILRASFDEGGYQLYDAAGETIVIPFLDHNLYAMKFGISTNGSMYFVNDFNAPVLYLPRDGYLDNATSPGARWYPFTPDWHTDYPVFIGIAPSWDAFVTMGWYPHMAFWGGYWCDRSYWAGGVFVPTFGLVVVIGGHTYHGWAGYHGYFGGRPGWSRIGFGARDYNHLIAHPSLARAPFRGLGPTHVSGRPFSAGRVFRGAGGFSGAGHTFRGAGGFSGAGHAFRGAGGSFGSRPNHPGAAAPGNDRAFRGGFHGDTDHAAGSGGWHSGPANFHGGHVGTGHDHTFQGGGGRR
jgi:hypothetical protein